MPRWLSAALLAVPLAAGAQESVRYVDDELAVTVRQGPDASSPSLGVLTSGARVELLESDAGSGYARVRMPDGRDGWIVERYLTRNPIARERLQQAERELAAARAELETLRERHEKLKEEHARATAGQPPAAPEELVRENAALKATMAEYDAERERTLARYNVEKEQQNTLLLGGLLAGGGFLLALLAVWLAPRRRRWSDL